MAGFPGSIAAPAGLFVVATRDITTSGTVALATSLSLPASWQAILVE